MRLSKETATVDAWLRDVRNNKTNRRRYGKFEYVEERIGAFFTGPLRRYRNIYNPKAASDGDRLDFSWSTDEEALQRLIALNRKYVVVSNQMDPVVSAADIFRASRKRSHIETRMRYLKSQLKVRPVFLESEMRIRGLAFVTNLALVVLNRNAVPSRPECQFSIEVEQEPSIIRESLTDTAEAGRERVHPREVAKGIVCRHRESESPAHIEIRGIGLNKARRSPAHGRACRVNCRCRLQ